MISYSRELEKPKSEAEFEEMCLLVYSEVFQDPLAKLNGRRGQAQGGVDVYVRANTGRIGIQSKRYKDNTLKLKHVTEEIAKAEAGLAKIELLIIATTAANDANLGNEVMALSDKREADGKFGVQVEFWDDIRMRIAKSPTLQRLYDPNAPGALFYRIDRGQATISQTVALISSDVQSLKALAFDTALPSALEASIHSSFTCQIDAIKKLLECSRYREANALLELLAGSFNLFDTHQKARWYLQRGICRIHLFNAVGAAEDLILASQMYPQDDKLIAAGVRGLVLQEKFGEAVAAGQSAAADWPGSVEVWTALAYARIENGEILSFDDVPPQMVDERRVLALFCWASIDADDNALAASYGQKLLSLPEPSLTEKMAAFTAALHWAAENPIERDHGFIKLSAREALEAAILALEPRSESIWSNQSLASRSVDASNLAYAYYLLDRHDEVLNLCAEAAGYMQLSDRLVSLKLVALKALDRIDEMLHLVPTHIGQIEPAAAAVIAEVASWRGRTELISALAANTLGSDGGYDRETISMFAALAMLNAGQRDDALKAVKDVHCTGEKCIGPTIVAARVLLAAGEKTEANARIEEVLSAIPVNASAENKLMLADCLYFLKRYIESAKFYAPYCTPGHHSLLHTRLLRSYVESGQRDHARRLIETFPSTWVKDDEALEIAVSLAQRAADWARLIELAEQLLILRPDSAGAWLLRVVAEQHGGSKQAFLSFVSTLPEVLQGSVRQQAQLAVLQFQYGHSPSGIRRLYRMMRNNMNNPTAASAYMTCMCMRGSEKDFGELVEVTSGTTVHLIDDSGNETRVNIDIADIGELPVHIDFHLPNSRLSGFLIGKRKGETVVIQGQIGASRTYTVANVEPVYVGLLTAQFERVSCSPEGLPSVWSVNMQTQDGTIDLTEMTAILNRDNERIRTILDTYANNPITLGVCAKSLGITGLELLQQWPIDGPSLRECMGDRQESINAINLLAKRDKPLVFDLTTLSEVVDLGCVEALASYDTVYITSAATHILDGLIVRASDDKSVARAASIGGHVRFIEVDKQDRQIRLDSLNHLKNVIAEYCIVRPAYGNGNVPVELTQLEDLLGDDEYEALLLAHELNATLVSVDLELRKFAAISLDVSGAWTQIFLACAALKGAISEGQYRHAMQKLLCENRTFLRIQSDDVLMAIRQGGPNLISRLENIRSMFQSQSSEALSCTQVIEDVITGIAVGQTALGVVREMVEYLYEPLFRHPSHLPDLEQRALSLMQRISRRFARVANWFPLEIVRLEDNQYTAAVGHYLEDGVRCAARRAANPVVDRPFPFQAMKVTKAPQLCLF